MHSIYHGGVQFYHLLSHPMILCQHYLHWNSSKVEFEGEEYKNFLSLPLALWFGSMHGGEKKYIQVSITFIQVSITFIQVSITYIQVSRKEIRTYIQVSEKGIHTYKSPFYLAGRRG